MKINDIVNEGILGSIGHGLLRGLDYVGGGTGDVGTANQRAAAQQKQADKKFNQQLASYGKLGHTATVEFINRLRQHGTDISRAGTFNPAEIQQELKFFADHYFGSDADSVISQYVKHSLEAEPLPNQINPTTVQQYLDTINQYRTEAIVDRYKAARTVAMHKLAAQDQEKLAAAHKQVELDNLVAKIKHDEQVASEEKQRYGKESSELAKRLILNKKLYQDITGQAAPSFAPQQPAQATQQTQQAQQLPTTPGGVQLIRNASRDSQGRPTPTVVRYRRQDFGLLDNGTWINIMNGKQVPPTLASFLQQELESL